MALHRPFAAPDDHLEAVATSASAARPRRAPPGPTLAARGGLCDVQG